MLLKDVIDLNNKNNPFPTLTSCIVCGGIAGFYSFKFGSVLDKDLAYKVSLIQYGFYLAKWESNVINREFFPTKCSCECRHEFEYKRIQMSETRWTCKYCGWSQIIDSSD